MDFIYSLFPPEGMFVNAGWEAYIALICLIILPLLALRVKRFLGRLFKSRTQLFRGRRTHEQSILNTLTAGPPKQKGGFVRNDFAAFEGSDLGRDRQEIIRRHFETCSHVAVQTGDWNHYGENKMI